MREAQVNGRGRWERRATSIAPLTFTLPGDTLGRVHCARRLADAEWTRFDPTAHGLSAEPKRNSFGVLDDRIVAIDDRT